MDNYSVFFGLDELNCIQYQQIPIRKKTYDYLMKVHYPLIIKDYKVFKQDNHFIICDKASNICCFDATYMLFENKGNIDTLNDDELVAVVTEYKYKTETDNSLYNKASWRDVSRQLFE